METTDHLGRVGSTITEPILEFFRFKGVGNTFHMHELLQHVAESHMVAPDSPGRIMRDLRQKGALGYTLVNRRASEYLVTRA